MKLATDTLTIAVNDHSTVEVQETDNFVNVMVNDHPGHSIDVWKNAAEGKVNSTTTFHTNSSS